MLSVENRPDQTTMHILAAVQWSALSGPRTIQLIQQLQHFCYCFIRSFNKIKPADHEVNLD